MEICPCTGRRVLHHWATWKQRGTWEQKAAALSVCFLVLFFASFCHQCNPTTLQASGSSFQQPELVPVCIFLTQNQYHRAPKTPAPASRTPFAEPCTPTPLGPSPGPKDIRPSWVQTPSPRPASGLQPVLPATGPLPFALQPGGSGCFRPVYHDKTSLFPFVFPLLSGNA